MPEIEPENARRVPFPPCEDRIPDPATVGVCHCNKLTRDLAAGDPQQRLARTRSDPKKAAANTPITAWFVMGVAPITFSSL
jgi:hypothetical protein